MGGPDLLPVAVDSSGCHQLDEVGAALHLASNRLSHCVGAIRLSPEDVRVAAGHTDHAARSDDPGSRDQPELGGSGHGQRDRVGGSVVSDCRHPSPQVQPAVGSTAEHRQIARLLLHEDVGLLRGVPDQVHMGINEAR